MLESFPIAVMIATVLGFLSGLGVGGGSLLILWLTLILGKEPQTARIINLLFFLPSALIACTMRWKHAELKISPLVPAIIAGCVCAALFSRFSWNPDIRKLFGILLLFIGIRELLHK